MSLTPFHYLRTGFCRIKVSHHPVAYLCFGHSILSFTLSMMFLRHLSHSNKGSCISFVQGTSWKSYPASASIIKVPHLLGLCSCSFFMGHLSQAHVIIVSVVFISPPCSGNYFSVTVSSTTKPFPSTCGAKNTSDKSKT